VGLQPTRKYPYVLRRQAYREPRRLSRVLSDEFFAPTVWKASNEISDLSGNDLYGVWKSIPGAHKWLHYFETYQDVRDQLHSEPIRMLEIGVYKGGSLRMWRECLSRESTIVGIDIDPSCQRFENKKENLHVRIGDQSNHEFLAQVVEEFGPFDFVLDDGSHVCSHMIESFNYLFLHGLKNGGIYLAEDTHSNFWPSHRDRRYSFMDMSKDLVDFMHAHYWSHNSELYFRKDHAQRAANVVVPRICKEIDEIRFEDSLVVIRKSAERALPVSMHN
jgi:hypothetical protein